MTEEGSLEPILEEVRRYHRAAEATPEEMFNGRHRQFLDQTPACKIDARIQDA
ncbi:hypothetical protein [Bradyrhizobium sp. USDA 3650]